MVGILAIVGPSIAAGAKVAEYLVEPIKSQYVYLFRYKRNIGKLRNEAETLENTRAGVQHLVDEAKRNLKIIGSDVEAWLRRVDEIQKETELVMLTADKVENRRWLNYSLSRKAVKKFKVIVELQGKSRFEHISYDPPPPIVTAPMSLSRTEGFESRLSILRGVMKALNEDKIHMIGICGMGGVGKTTMAKDIAAKVIEERLFDEVVMAVVTQSPDLKSIQGSIAELLGLKLGEESLLARAARLCERLKGHTRVLVILDDIWGRLDLEELGMPPVAEEQHKGSCTIVLTSRSADACGEMGAERIFWIEPMPHEEAWVLFQRTADKLFDPDLFRVAEDIVKECGGLPLAIVTITRALRSKKQKFMWDDALQSLRNSNFKSDYAAVYSALEVSYEFLESYEMQHLFLLCCLYPQGYDIPIEDLLRLGSGLSLFTYMVRVDLRRTRANACIQKLKNLSLLLDCRDEECVRMHDLVHTFALFAASREENLFVVSGNANGVTFWPRKDTKEICTKISLWCEDMQGLLAGLEFEKLELLLLVGSSYMSQFGENFYFRMGQLKVLIHRGMLIESLPKSFQCLSTLHTLCLDYCTFGKECDISMIGNLVNLEILSFVHSNVKEIPSNVGNLTRLRLLDMSGCEELLRIASGVLRSLIRLEELYMRGTLLNWLEVQTVECLKELTSLSLLTALEIELSRFELLPVDMVYEKLTRFRICIGFAIESQVFQNTIKLVDVELWNWSRIRVLFHRAEILLLQGRPSGDHVGHLHSLFWSGTKDFSKLRSFTVQDCHGLVYLVETYGWAATNDFAMLESLYLHRLSSLTEIWHIEHSEQSSREITEQEPMEAQQPHSWMCSAQLPSFGNLCVLDIVSCCRLKYVFSLSTARSLVKLEIVKIADCLKLEEIFSSEDEKVVVKIELPKLKSLKLVNLPVLACFCKKADAVVFPELVDLELDRLPKIKFTYTRVDFSDTESKNHTSSSDISSKQKVALGRKTEVSDTTKKLTTIKSDIPPTPYDAKSVLSSHLIQSLQYPHEVLVISSCCSVEVVFDLEAPIIEGGNNAVVVQNSLRVLKLCSLPTMTLVWKHGLEIFQGFKNLTEVSLCGCGSIIYLFSTLIANSLVQLKILVIRNCKNIEVIVKEENGLEMTAKAPSKIVFPRLSSIKLIELPKLRCFSSDRVEFEWPLLKFLKIDNCEKMLNFTAGNSSFQGVVNSTLRSAQYKIALGKETKVSDTTKKLTEIESDILPTQYDAKLRVSVLPSHSTQSLHLLEVVDITNCHSLEVVFDLEAPIIGGKELKLSFLPNMTHVWKHGFETFEGFKNLTTLSLDSCDSINYLFSTLIANFLVQLHDLVIKSCAKMEVIVKEENELEMGANALSKIVFPRLTSIELYYLPKLRCLCSGLGVEFEWPLLESVKIDYCKEMLIFTEGNSSTPRLRDIDINSRKYSFQGDVNFALRTAQHKVTPVQQANNNMNASSSRSLT